MSRFDDFAKSRASGRGWLAAWRGSRSESGASTAPDPSRRNLLKRAGLVGGAAVVGSTLVQSVTAPAIAVSGVCTGTNELDTCGGTCPPCPIGQGCAADVDCEVGLICRGGVCQAGTLPNTLNGGACAHDAECRSFYCNSTTHKCEANPTGSVYPGGTCHAANPASANLQCTGANGRCIDGKCKSGNNGFCRTQEDCAQPFVCRTEEWRCLYPPG